MPVPPNSIKISQLPAGTTPNSTDQIPVNEGGVTKRVNAGDLPADWRTYVGNVTAVVYNGNRNYTLTVDADPTALISPGMAARTTRAVAAPTQCTSLNGTNQYFNKISPAGMTGTNSYTFYAHVKPGAYGTTLIQSKFSSSGSNNGWNFYLSNGQVVVEGWSANNVRRWTSYQALNLNRGGHVTGRLDMTSTATSGVITIDGIDVPVAYNTTGSPTAWTNAGNYEIGSQGGGGLFFPGKLSQVAVFNALISQATLRTYISQGLTGTEPNLISAYSFNNSINDLNTTTGNNLSPNGSATATNADSPFGYQAGGAISSTFDYGLIHAVTSTTINIQVAEGCSIPTIGGVAALSYSGAKSPYGFPKEKGKWALSFINGSDVATTSTTYGQMTGAQLTAPIGAWIPSGKMSYQHTTSDAYLAISTSTSAPSDPTLAVRLLSSSSATHLDSPYLSSSIVSLNVSAATPVYIIGKAATGTLTLRGLGDIPAFILLDNAYL